MNAFIKKLYYTLVKPDLNQGYTLSLGFIFHTEKIYDEVVFNRLLTFCKEYHSITGKRALCTIMPPVSFRVKDEMQQRGVLEEKFIDNLKTLQSVADLGFHGHFWRTIQKSFEEKNNQIRNSTYEPADEETIKQQFQDQINWFRSANGIHAKSYAAGWWFTNRAIMQLQALHGIVYDFSLAKMKWTSGDWGKKLMQENQIAFGEPFVLETVEGKINCVQTIMGTPNTKFPQDFVRIINTLLDSENRAPIGMITTHDYDLVGDNLQYAIAQIRYLKTKKGIQFFSIEDLSTCLRDRALKSVKV